MNFEGPAQKGRFISRPNRFTALVEVDGQIIKAFVPNSGRLSELMQPGRLVYLRRTPESKRSSTGGLRRTAWDLTLIETQDGDLVSVDARLPAVLLVEAIASGKVQPFSNCTLIRREVVFGESRLDLLLKDGNKSCYVETKSVTLVRNGKALFPDAPTPRASRHLEELIKAVARGYRASVVFVVQRADARIFAPNIETDPFFAATLNKAVRQGVEVYATVCRVAPGHIAVDSLIPVQLRE